MDINQIATKEDVERAKREILNALQQRNNVVKAIYDLSDVMTYTGYSKKVINDLIAQGRLNAWQDCGKLSFYAQDVHNLIPPSIRQKADLEAKR